MTTRSALHTAVLEELTEWWEDVRDHGVSSQVVFLPAPHGWGRSHLLSDFVRAADDSGGPVSFIVCIGKFQHANPRDRLTSIVSVTPLPAGSRAVQAMALREALAKVSEGSVVAQRLGIDSLEGKAQLGLGVGSLFVSGGLAAAVPLLLASLGLTAAGNSWDASPAGQQGGLARTARQVARVSVSAPVAVVIDDADDLDADLADAMITSLADRYDGRVLVVAGVAPGSELAKRLTAPDRYDLFGRVHKADADDDMSYGTRAILARQLAPGLPDVVIERIASRTGTFADVFVVTEVRNLPELASESGVESKARLDAMIDTALVRREVSTEATVLAWAGGVLTVRQADRALKVLDSLHREHDPWVSRFGGIARLAGSPSVIVARHAESLAASDRHRLAAVLLDEAATIATQSDVTLIDLVVARQAAHRVRGDLEDRAGLTKVQCLLIRGLERLGDPAAAYEVAKIALAELPAGDLHDAERRELYKALLRLARAQKDSDEDPLIAEAVAQAASNGAMFGLEAQTWAAVNLLSRPGHRDAAIQLASQVAEDLADQPVTDETANQLRLLLAFHAGRAGHPGISQQLLTRTINAGTSKQQKAAHTVLRAIGGPQADARLQIVVLEAELEATHGTEEATLLRLHSTLAASYDTLGNYAQALEHRTEELKLRLRLQGPDNPQTLLSREDVAHLTGQCGDSEEALRQLTELLPDMVRVLGADHPDVLEARFAVALWTGETGHSAEARRLFEGLLPDLGRILGSHHRIALIARASIARWTGECGDKAEALHLTTDLLPDLVQVLGLHDGDVLGVRAEIASWTGQCGDSREALRQLTDLLPDVVEVLGVEHPNVMTTRANIADLTHKCGDSREALRQLTELLPDLVRVLGADHPDVLAARVRIAHWTGECGDSREALRQFTVLLPDMVRLAGADHPEVVRVRSYIARWTGECGDMVEALRLSTDLLPDVVRILGADHPDVLTARVSIAYWTGESGDSVQALRQFTGLLPDAIRVLGADHPDVLAARASIARWTGESGDSMQALRQFSGLLPDRVRVLGADHPDVLRHRSYIARWTGECGDSAQALRLYQALLPVQVRVLGPDHPEVQATRRAMAALEVGQS
jgi:uncharacterized protein YidB (DUF937 family)